MTIEEKLKLACRELEKNDSYLLMYDASEWAVAHHLAKYLEKYFPDYHVDCEYNRMLKDPDSPHIQEYLTKSLEAGRNVQPDIIVHHRGHNKDNLVIIELKKVNSSKALVEENALKLRRYLIDTNLAYKYAYQVLLEKTGLKATPITKDFQEAE